VPDRLPLEDVSGRDPEPGGRGHGGSGADGDPFVCGVSAGQAGSRQRPGVSGHV